MVFPSCTHREPSASFDASGVKTQAKLEQEEKANWPQTRKPHRIMRTLH
jgi:hypothetical protein